MSDRPFSVGGTAAATILIAGLLVLMFPYRAPGIVQIVLVTFAALAGLYLVSIVTPPGSVTGRWSSPFDRGAPDASADPVSSELATLRARLGGRRVVVQDVGPIPPETLRLLQRIVTSALDRVGIDPDEEHGRAAARARLSPLTWAVLTADPPTAPSWTRRRWPSPAGTAELVHRILDDLEHVTPSSPLRRPGSS